MADIEKIRDFFKHDYFAMSLGIQIEEAQEGSALCSLAVQKSHLNAGNAVQGGVTFTLADFAFAVAANTDGRMTVSLTNTISYIHPPKGSTLFARAEKVSASKHICVYTVTVTDDKGTLVAHMTVNGYIKEQPLNF